MALAGASPVLAAKKKHHRHHAAHKVTNSSASSTTTSSTSTGSNETVLTGRRFLRVGSGNRGGYASFSVLSTTAALGSRQLRPRHTGTGPIADFG